MDNIKVKIVKVVGTLIVAGTLIPANLFSYATSDISYVEEVSNTIEIETTSISENSISNNKGEMGENIVTDVAEVLGMEVNEDNTYSLVFGEELAKYNIIYKFNKDEKALTEQFNDLNEITSAKLGDTNIIEVEEEKEDVQSEEETEDDTPDETNEEPVVEEKAKPSIQIIQVDQSEALLSTDTPDENYTGSQVILTPEDRQLLERLVMGEAGGEGMKGAALVTQAIRDTMIYKGFTSVEDVRQACKYSGSTSKEPNQDVLDAVAYIFDNGGIAVKHTIFYFYAPARCNSSFHESQKFIVEYAGHRFFSNN